MTFCTYIHVPQRMNPDDFGDHLTFQLVPTSNVSSTLFYDQIPANIRTPLQPQLYFVVVVNVNMLN